MVKPPNNSPAIKGKASRILAVLVVICAVSACSIWANLSFAITDKANLKYLPPFKPYVNVNGNRHLGGEYYQMAHALAAGEGFSHPMDQPTGPTAWQPPLLPLFMAATLWASNGDRDIVMTVVLFMQAYVLIGTAFLVLALVRQTARRIGPIVAAAVFVCVLLIDFGRWFQVTHDTWFVLLAIDLLLAGLCWLDFFQGWKTAAGWGLFGGFCAMVNPIVGFTWGVCSIVAAGVRQRSWSRLAISLLFAGLALAPWTIRNYLVFGRFIPVKSNLAFEMYQSQCLQPDGLLLKFINHPFGTTKNSEGRQYKALGEMAYLDRKREQFWQSVWADPLDFLDRVAYRFLGATLWYVPFNGGGQRRAWDIWICRLTHPLPFLALMFLGYSAFWKPLHAAQWTAIGVYFLYLLPYVSVSYYDRYALPLLAVKLLMVLWAADRLLCVCNGLFGKTKTGLSKSSLLFWKP
jgi:hypothetical protein